MNPWGNRPTQPTYLQKSHQSPETAPRKGDMVMIEDYTTSGNGLANLRKALTHTGRPARVAIIGDSYIEGDVFSQNVREYLQQAYGGRGVGYMGLHS